MESEYLKFRRSLKNGKSQAVVPEKPKVNQPAQKKSPAVAPKKKRKPPKKQSKKKRKENLDLKINYGPFLEKHPICTINSPDCTREATVVNHRRGRGSNVHNQKDWQACCPPCNSYIESHPTFNGGRHKISQHKKTS